MSQLILPKQPVLDLPFKPFTLDEVKAITNAPSKFIDDLLRAGLPQKVGAGAQGLDYYATFAVFVGWRWKEEGAPNSKVTDVCSMVASMTMEFMEHEFNFGRMFPVMGPNRRGIMVVPPDSRLGKTLNLKILLAEFQYNVAKVFPKG